MNFICFRISGQGINLNELSTVLGMVPQYSHTRGDIYYDKITKQAGTYSDDYWIASVEINDVNETEKRIEALVDSLYRNKEYVQQTSRVHAATLWVTVYQDVIQHNLHFSKNVLAKISELDIDLDITCMQLQEFYRGTNVWS